MVDTPPVSCMCLTYGRPHLLEEAVESFLRQDYCGVKELIVLNDFDRHVLRFDHPEVHVINVPKRFSTVGEKRNACAALATHHLLFVWDDDDIYLPHRLSYSVSKLTSDGQFYKSPKAFMLHNGVISGPASAIFHSGCCFTRSLFNQSHGYHHMGAGEDREIELAFSRILGTKLDQAEIQLDEIYYIYRWGGTESFHLSGYGRDTPGKKTGAQRVAEYVERQCQQSKVPVGEVQLQPTWRIDYLATVRDYVTAIRKNPKT